MTAMFKAGRVFDPHWQCTLPPITCIVYQTAMESIRNPAIPHVMIRCSTLLRNPNSQMTILPPFYKTGPGHLQNDYATALKITQNFIHVHVRYWVTKVNTGYLTSLEIPLFIRFIHGVIRECILKYVTEPSLFQPTLATVRRIAQDLIWRMKSQSHLKLHHPNRSESL